MNEPSNINSSGDENNVSFLRRVFGQRVPQSIAVFWCQAFIIFVVITTSLYNLSTSTENHTLWTALLSSCLGYVLPNPSIKK